MADDDAKLEAALSMSAMTDYSDVSAIVDDEYTADDIPTLELNNWILNGTKALVSTPAALKWGVWSSTLSDENGDFTANPVLTATTSGSYSTAGFTVTFGGDTWPKQTVTTWYSGSTVLGTQTDDVTGFTHFISREVSGYNKIVIEFVGTDVPYRRVKIVQIDYGEIFVWSGESIISASVLEEVNLTGSELTINTLDLSIHDENSDFNMLNPSGTYEYLQQRQQLRVTEYINGAAVNMGRYYLTTWKNSSIATADFEAQDMVGVFDGITYTTSQMWAGATVAAIIADIMSAAGFTKYSIESSIASETLTGYIPVVTVREALHQVCFAARCSVISKRDGTLLITRLPSSEDANAISKSQKMGSQTITQNDLVNSVAVTAYTFAAASSTSQLYSAELEAGTYTITFSTPAKGLTISGGTITQSGINYAVVTVTTAGTVTVTGYQYSSSATTYTVEADGLTDAKRSQATVDSIYLISPANGADVAQFVYDDYQSRIVQKFEIAVEDEGIGDNVEVETMLDLSKTGVIVSMDIDLTGGFTATLEVRG
ncbi:MAG: hypothetical protein H6Q60_1154 [Oscillospiraceae bacterium]|nr:hypothetical protein [Oscillospiraceae bacterium]